MADPRAIVRLVDELLWVLRREGLAVSTAQAIDAVRALGAVGLSHRETVREAIAALVVTRAGDRARFDRAFDAFFASSPEAARAASLWERLAARGFDAGELDVLRALMGTLGAGAGAGAFGSLDLLVGRGADLDRALSLAGFDEGVAGDTQLGFFSYRLLSRMGFDDARRELAALRQLLAGALGARGEALAEALAGELQGTEAQLRALVRHHYDESRREEQRLHSTASPESKPFFALTEAEIEEVRRAVRSLAERLRGGARLRARRRRRHGRIDPHRTLRRALGTGGVPFRIERKHRRRDRPKLVLLCDISDSVRAAARFLLEFTFAAQEIFQRTRSFVFVSDLGETTQLFAREPVQVAVARAWRGEIVSTGDNSNYGRALRAFDARFSRDLDRRTTVVVLGDGRTNYLEPAAEVLTLIRDRARALIWLCPEPHSQWGQGDSAMPSYAPRCTVVLEVRCAADLEAAARRIIARV